MRARTARTLRWCGLLLCAAAPAQAAGAGESGSHVWNLLWQILNLAILLGVLAYVGRGPIRRFFASRGDRIRTDLDEAADLLAQAEARYSRWQQKLDALDEELAQLRADARSRAAQEREAILAEAQAAAERIHRDAVATVDQELRRAQAKLRAEATELATGIAEQILREALSKQDHDRLTNELVARIEPGNDASPGGAGSRR